MKETSSPWIRTAERRPLLIDGYPRGHVIWWHRKYGALVGIWDRINLDYEFWMPIPPVPEAQQTPAESGDNRKVTSP